mmetsp:Transcript_67494/g.213576  ORF Transcript_67494/g.213576 Transcript_67494/m.213576 type:complete len:562 (+) Transcript_67494:59-1744(+)
MGAAGGKVAGSGELRLPLRGEGAPTQVEEADSREEGCVWREWATWFALLLVDAIASVAFWAWFLYFPDRFLGAFFAVFLAAMVLWRLWRLWQQQQGPGAPGGGECAEVPYSCGFVSANGKELFLVATVHISPRAPRDVRAVISGVKPDAAMIELDEERLDRLRDVELQMARQPEPEDLQEIRITWGADSEPVTVLAQRALWNAEREGERVCGRVVFEPENAYGFSPPQSSGQIALVHRGGPNSELSPFAVKAHAAAQGGAQALLVVNGKEDRMPVQRLGGGPLLGDLRIALRTRNLGFPRVPVLLLPHSDGQRLREECEKGADVQASFEIMPDAYPRRTLPRRLCQGCALMFSGIGILYGIIGCFDVEVGAEFLAAEAAASARGIPCTCIDVDLNRFWSRLGMAVLPTPCNLLQSLLSWLAFPRVCFRALFPPKGNVDIFGSMVLHASSFPCRTWVAFVLAGFCASFITSHVLELLGFGVEQAGEGTGVVAKEDRDEVQALIMCIAEMYLLPQIYDAVAASRDEAMYRSIVAKGRHARRLVVVVGAGHANGILQRARTRGL